MDKLFLKKKTLRVIIIAAMALVTALSVGFAVNRIIDVPSDNAVNQITAVSSGNAVNQITAVPSGNAVNRIIAVPPGNAVNRITDVPSDNNELIEMKMVYEYNPAYFLKDMTLVWGDTVYHQTQMFDAGRGAEIGYAIDEYSTWQIFELEGYDHDYLLAVESEDVWRVMSSHLAEGPWRQYVLENATEKQRLERMLSVSLYSDGTVRLATSMISSYAMISPCYYSFADNELLIFYDRDDIIARFEVVDDDTLVFLSSTVSLYADSGARYVSNPTDTIKPSF